MPWMQERPAGALAPCSILLESCCWRLSNFVKGRCPNLSFSPLHTGKPARLHLTTVHSGPGRALRTSLRDPLHSPRQGARTSQPPDSHLPMAQGGCVTDPPTPPQRPSRMMLWAGGLVFPPDDQKPGPASLEGGKPRSSPPSHLLPLSACWEGRSSWESALALRKHHSADGW